MVTCIYFGLVASVTRVSFLKSQ